MISMHITFDVKPEHVDAFIAACHENATHTWKEAGNVRFDMYQDSETPTRFYLVEVYASAEAQKAHLQADYFSRWRTITSDMVANSSLSTSRPTFLKGNKA